MTRVQIAAGAVVVIAATVAAVWWFAGAGARERATQPARQLVMPAPAAAPAPQPAAAAAPQTPATAAQLNAPAPVQLVPLQPAGTIKWTPGPLSSIGQFALTDQNGNQVSEGALRGHYSLVFFGYTHCELCINTLNEIVGAFRELGVSAETTRAYFITVDPLRDTRDVMKRLFATAPEQMIGLTGTEDQVMQAVRAFTGARVVKPGADPATYTIDHTAVVFFVGRDSLIISAFPENTPWKEMARRMRDMR